MTLRVLDIFSGIGGFSLGLERAGGFRTVAFCEIEPYCRAVLRKHWPDVPIFEDVTKLGAADVGPVDVICGGFPCQPFSTASRGRRVARDLWPEFARLVNEMRPRLVIAENVQELPIRRASSYFRSIGYSAFEQNLDPIAAGAPIARNRWWSIAHTHDKGQLHSAINAEMAKLSEVCEDLWGWQNFARAIRVSDGLPHRMDRLKALGNAVIPQIIEMIGNAALASLQKETDAPLTESRER